MVITHPIGIGKVGWRTPEGVTKIVRRQKDPTWRVPVSVRKEHHENGEELDPVIGPGPDNPLGKYAFYLQWPSYLIHGTNKPAGVGLRSSHGCIRLYPEDIEQFFNMVPIGTQVRVVNQPFLFGWRDGQLYLQPYDVLEDDTRDWNKAQKKLLTAVAGRAAAAAAQVPPRAGRLELVSSLTQQPARHTGTDHRVRCERRADPGRRSAGAERAARGLHLGRQDRSADGRGVLQADAFGDRAGRCVCHGQRRHAGRRAPTAPGARAPRPAPRRRRPRRTAAEGHSRFAARCRSGCS